MAIYDFSTKDSDELSASACNAANLSYGTSASSLQNRKGTLFSAVASRLFFLLLLLADLLWMTYTILSSAVFLLVILCTGGRFARIREWQSKKWISLRRSLVCAVALVVALFSPSFGVMVACTYFLMYDKAGIEEVVPSALQSEFKELLPKGS
jgi:cation transport ATPase